MTDRDTLKCESMRWGRPRGRMMGLSNVQQWCRQQRINHAQKIFIWCLVIAVGGLYLVAFLAADRIGVIAK